MHTCRTIISHIHVHMYAANVYAICMHTTNKHTHTPTHSSLRRVTFVPSVFQSLLTSPFGGRDYTHVVSNWSITQVPVSTDGIERPLGQWVWLLFASTALCQIQELQIAGFEKGWIRSPVALCTCSRTGKGAARRYSRRALESLFLKEHF